MHGVRSKSARFWRITAYSILLFCLAAPPAVVAFVRSGFALDLARRQASEALYAELGLDTKLGEITIELPRLSLTARDVALMHPEHGELAFAQQLVLEASLLSLLRGKPKLRSIGIEGARVRLLVRDGKVVNLPLLRERRAGPWNLPFRQLRISDARLAIDAGSLGHVELLGMSARVDVARGELAGIEVRAGGGQVRHPAGEETIHRVLARGEFAPGHARLARLLLETTSFDVNLREALVTWPLGRAYRGDLELDFDLARMRQLPFGFDLPLLRGDASLKARFSGTRSSPRATGVLRVRDASIGDYRLGESVEVAFEANRHTISMPRGQLRMHRGGGRLAFKGELGLTSQVPFDVKVDVERVSFANLMQQLNVTPDAIVEWQLGGHFRLAGSLAPLKLRGPLRFRTHGFQVTRQAHHVRPARYVLQVPKARVAAEVAVSSEGIHLQNLRADAPRSVLHASVLLGFDDRLRAHVHSRRLDLRDVSPLADFPIAGIGEFVAEVVGSYRDPKVSGRLNMHDFAFNTFPLGDVESAAIMEKGGHAVRFPSVRAVKRGSRYRVDDMLLDFSNDRFEATARLLAHKLLLRDFYHVFHYGQDERFKPYQGEVNGRAQVHYTHGFPGDSRAGTLVADVDVVIPQVNLKGFLFDRGHFRGRWKWLDHYEGYEAGILSVEHASLRKGPGTVKLSGSMRLGAKLDMVVVADRIRFGDTEGLADRLPDLSGTYGVSGTLGGTLALPRADLDVVATGTAWKGMALGDARAYVRLTDPEDPWVKQALAWKPGKPPADAKCGHAREGLARGRWPADPALRTVNGPQPALVRPQAFLVCGSGLGGALRADLAMGRTLVYPLRGLVAFDSLPVASFVVPRSLHARDLHGLVTGTVTLHDGAMLEPHTLVGDVYLDRVTVGQRDVQLRNDSPLALRVEQGAFRIGHAGFVGPGSHLDVSGRGSIYDGLDLTLAGRVDLGLLASLSSTLSSARGNVGLRFSVTGPLEHPGIYGHAAVADADVRFASFDTPIRGLTGQLTFSAQRVLLEDFRARVGGGELAFGGMAQLSGRRLAAYKLDVTARQLSVSPEEDIDMQFGGSGTLQWQQGDRLPLLHGILRLTRMHYGRTIQLGRMAIGDMSKSERANVKRYDPAADRVALDLRVLQLAPMRIQTNLIDAELAIQDTEREFRIVGTDQRFGVLGTVGIGRGTVRFRDSEFSIREGRLNFDDKTSVAPHFEVQAVTDVRRSVDLSRPDWHISMHAKGNIDSFELSMSSDPYLSEEDIVMLLTMGMTRAELNQLQAGSLQGTAALEALATVTGVDREVRKAVPVDDFRIGSAYSMRTNRTEPQLFVGKRIADRVRLNAATGLSEARDFRTSVQWQLNKRTSVEAVYNNQNTEGTSSFGNVGVDLRWRLEFE
ncbi:MAG: translocation/assembly module TamB domain-containing protein [Proteobacteria bacterium]|nr:translocation/assembly module TamB domain-containing protein [Pseudomonadota bacterium]